MKFLEYVSRVKPFYALLALVAFGCATAHGEPPPDAGSVPVRVVITPPLAGPEITGVVLLGGYRSATETNWYFLALDPAKVGGADVTNTVTYSPGEKPYELFNSYCTNEIAGTASLFAGRIYYTPVTPLKPSLRFP
jgi:hypothetical protein